VLDTLIRCHNSVFSDIARLMEDMPAHQTEVLCQSITVHLFRATRTGSFRTVHVRERQRYFLVLMYSQVVYEHNIRVKWEIMLLLTAKTVSILHTRFH